MLNGKVMIIHLIVRLITKKYCYIKMSYFPIYGHSKDKIEIKLDLFNYATKSDLQNVTGVDASQSAKKDDLANLKTEVDKLDIDKLAKLDADKLKTVPINFKKFNDVADKKVIEKDVYDGLVKNVDATDTSKLLTKTDYNAKIKDIEDKIPTHWANICSWNIRGTFP